jgi:membrane associated rhomboid family serine protease
MFPIKDNIPALRRPVVNIGIITANVIIFVLQLSHGPDLDGLIRSLGFVPAKFLAQQAHNPFDPSRFVPVFTSMFMHAGFLHLGGNMWFLWIFGDNVEDCMGHGRYLVFYLLCGMVSVMVQTWSAPGSTLPLVGASGAISGVLGAYLLTYPRARVLTLVPIFILFYLIELPAFFFLGFWIAMQALAGYVQLMAVDGQLQGGVAWWAHLGGFASGALLVFLFRRQDWRRELTRRASGMRRIGG